MAKWEQPGGRTKGDQLLGSECRAFHTNVMFCPQRPCPHPGGFHQARLFTRKSHPKRLCPRENNMVLDGGAQQLRYFLQAVEPLVASTCISYAVFCAASV